MVKYIWLDDDFPKADETVTETVTFLMPGEEFHVKHYYRSPLYRVNTGLGTPDLLVTWSMNDFSFHWDGREPLSGVFWNLPQIGITQLLCGAAGIRGETSRLALLTGMRGIIARLQERMRADSSGDSAQGLAVPPKLPDLQGYHRLEEGCFLRVKSRVLIVSHGTEVVLLKYDDDRYAGKHYEPSKVLRIVPGMARYKRYQAVREFVQLESGFKDEDSIWLMDKHYSGSVLVESLTMAILHHYNNESRAGFNFIDW